MNIVQYSWNGLPEETKVQIIDYRNEQFEGIIVRMCAEGMSDLLGFYEKLGKGKGYINVKWGVKEDHVLLEGYTWDKLIGEEQRKEAEENHSIGTYNRYLEFFYKSQKNINHLPIVSALMYPNPVNIPSQVIYGKDEEVVEEVWIASYPGDVAMMVVDTSVHDETIARTKKREEDKCSAKKLEKEKEDELYDWFRICGIDAERQVKTSSGHFVDIWVPNKLMVEVKRGTVTGNDVCQCIEYSSEYTLPILVVGEKITTAASRGLKGFNKLCPTRKIIYTTWDTVYAVVKQYV